MIVEIEVKVANESWKDYVERKLFLCPPGDIGPHFWGWDVDKDLWRCKKCKAERPDGVLSYTIRRNGNE